MISIIFTCRGRPNLTELCLSRLVELMQKPYEIILVYDGCDLSYVDRLLEAYDFDYIIMNPTGEKTRLGLINRGLDATNGSLYMHVENDFYWQDPACLASAVEAFALRPDLDFIRFEFLPFRESQCQEIINLSKDRIGILKKGTPFAFNLNPHLRREKFPMGRFPERSIIKTENRDPEEYVSTMWRGTSGCLMGKNFRHIGIYDEGGHYKNYYAERFHLRRGDKSLDPIREFESFCSNAEYRMLFRRYIEKHDTKKH